MSSVLYQWVLAQYDPRTEHGKSVERLVGHVYYLTNPNRTKGDPLIVAFKFVGYEVPDEYTVVTDEQQIAKLERWDKPWTAHADRRTVHPDAEPTKIGDMFPTKKAA